MTLRLAVALVALGSGAGTAAAQSSAPLVITATVVRSCAVETPRSLVIDPLPAIPVTVNCGRHRPSRVRVGRAPAPPNTPGTVIVIDF